MTSSSSLTSRLATYGAAAASAAAASSAGASIIYFDIPDLTTPTNNPTLVYFTPSTGLAALAPQANSAPYQFVLVGGTQFGLFNGVRPNAAFGVSPNSAVTLRSGANGDVARLTLGGAIGGAGVFAGPAGTLASAGFSYNGNFVRYGNWNVGLPNSGFIGFRFGTEGNFNYGWAEVTINANYSITLRSFAYENTPNTGIIAGAIPEPATSAALLLGLGAGGLGVYRSRRKQAA